MKQIPLTQGKFALVDDDMFEELGKFKWYAKKYKGDDYYAARTVNVRREDGKMSATTILMHREIIGASRPEQLVDHVNHFTLDNRVKNLRIATHSQNGKNRRSAKNSTSRFLGVTFSNCRNKWIAQIKIDGKNRHIGSFDSEIQAALKYNEAAKIHHGDFANLNIIPESSLFTAQNIAI